MKELLIIIVAFVVGGGTFAIIAKKYGSDCVP